LGKGDHLRERILSDPELKRLLKTKEVSEIFKGARSKKAIKEVLKRVL
jgi:hypothetical protein